MIPLNHENDSFETSANFFRHQEKKSHRLFGHMNFGRSTVRVTVIFLILNILLKMPFFLPVLTAYNWNRLLLLGKANQLSRNIFLETL